MSKITNASSDTPNNASSRLINKLKELVEKHRKLTEEINAEVSGNLQEVFGELFIEHPTLVRFSWRQYTPYFCDGDPCEFSVQRDLECISTEFIEDEGELVKGYDRKRDSVWDSKSRSYIKKEIPALDTEALNVAKKVSNLLNIIPEDSLKSLYGDHVEIVVSKDKIDTREYSHN